MTKKYHAFIRETNWEPGHYSTFAIGDFTS